jgi:hypothetical protein
MIDCDVDDFGWQMDGCAEQLAGGFAERSDDSSLPQVRKSRPWLTALIAGGWSAYHLLLIGSLSQGVDRGLQCFHWQPIDWLQRFVDSHVRWIDW